MDFEQNFDFLKPIKTYIRDHYDQEIQSFGQFLP
jgi:hypothetical protein